MDCVCDVCVCVGWGGVDNAPFSLDFVGVKLGDLIFYHSFHALVQHGD